MACVIYEFVTVIDWGGVDFLEWGGELMGPVRLSPKPGASPGVLEPNVYRRCNVTTRKLAAALIAPAAVLAVSGCSPGADYPSLFPAVHDMPPPRSDTTMDPLQVQQATEDLITERNHLSAGTQSPQQSGQAGNAPAVANARPAVVQATAGTSGNSQSATPVSAQTVGAETK
jgi:hypothetical protein